MLHISLDSVGFKCLNMLMVKRSDDKKALKGNGETLRRKTLNVVEGNEKVL